MQMHEFQDHRNYPPIFDINNLDEDHEIRIEYDGLGNPTRIRKVRRYEGCGLWLAILALTILGAAFLLR